MPFAHSGAVQLADFSSLNAEGTPQAARQSSGLVSFSPTGLGSMNLVYVLPFQAGSLFHRCVEVCWGKGDAGFNQGAVVVIR